MATLDKSVKKSIDKAFKYLQKCDDYTSSKAEAALSTIWQSQTGDINQIGLYLSTQGYGQLFGRMWSHLCGFLTREQWGKAGFSNLNLMLQTYLNFTDICPELCVELGKCGSIPMLFAGLKELGNYFEQEKEFKMIKGPVQNILFLLCNSISRASSNRKFFREADAYGIFKKYLTSQNGMVSLLSLMILAYVVDDTESGVLATSNGGVAILVKWLQSATKSSNHEVGFCGVGGSAKEILDCVNRLSINDSNKLEIEKEGGIPTIVRMLQDDFNEEEQCVAAEAVWNLTFVESIKNGPQLQEAVPLLDKLRHSTNRDLRNASAFAFWEINNNRHEDLPTRESIPQESPPSYEEAIKEPRQAMAHTAKVMISYQWDFQSIAEKIRDNLVNHGYRVWMDVTHLRADILSSMAEAVEKSEIILIFMSETYKNSQSCRTEAEYAYKLKKKVIPLLVQQDYTPDGWLGALQGMQLYYKFLSEDLTQTDLASLLTALEELTDACRRIPDEHDGPLGATQATTVHATPNPNSSVCNWTEEDVQDWLRKKKLDDLCETLDTFEGSHLEKMYSDYSRDPKEFKDELRSDYQMNAKTCLKFTVALEKLFKN
ncbi:uncharacterized protein [Amphiura filiformis]|uniref:uncharacterized protein n=1 Tax=Amphiura filiformis TaxID=82378 RepID=UPI003B21EDC9